MLIHHPNLWPPDFVKIIKNLYLASAVAKQKDLHLYPQDPGVQSWAVRWESWHAKNGKGQVTLFPFCKCAQKSASVFYMFAYMNVTYVTYVLTYEYNVYV